MTNYGTLSEHWKGQRSFASNFSYSIDMIYVPVGFGVCLVSITMKERMRMFVTHKLEED